MFALANCRVHRSAFRVTHIPADDSAREEGTVGQRDRLTGREHHARAAKAWDVAVRVEFTVPVRCACREESADQGVRKSAESCVTLTRVWQPCIGDVALQSRHLKGAAGSCGVFQDWSALIRIPGLELGSTTITRRLLVRGMILAVGAGGVHFAGPDTAHRVGPCLDDGGNPAVPGEVVVAEHAANLRPGVASVARVE